jgi:EAL domain-containing protein (putative c-di-GMP-specific phosphodiesterase class I)
LHNQPFYNAETEKISGFEALIRWNHPRRGTIPPLRFIPLAEEIGLIVPLGEWIIREVCAQAAKWPGNHRVAINLSPVQIKSPSLVPTVISALAASGLPGPRLELEITESVFLSNGDATLNALKSLKQLGVRIAMDDFGTGYSSLNYLRCFPFDKIKIDRSFIQDLGVRPDCLAIVQAVTTLAAKLGMTTTAEGVENARAVHPAA